MRPWRAVARAQRAASLAPESTSSAARPTVGSSLGVERSGGRSLGYFFPPKPPWLSSASTSFDTLFNVSKTPCPVCATAS